LLHREETSSISHNALCDPEYGQALVDVPTPVFSQLVIERGFDPTDPSGFDIAFAHRDMLDEDQGVSRSLSVVSDEPETDPEVDDQEVPTDLELAESGDESDAPIVLVEDVQGC
jgi:hypothetical protein